MFVRFFFFFLKLRGLKREVFSLAGQGVPARRAAELPAATGGAKGRRGEGAKGVQNRALHWLFPTRGTLSKWGRMGLCGSVDFPSQPTLTVLSIGVHSQKAYAAWQPFKFGYQAAVVL